MLFSLPMLKNGQMLLLYCFRKSLRQKYHMTYEPGNFFYKINIVWFKNF